MIINKLNKQMQKNILCCFLFFVAVQITLKAQVPYTISPDQEKGGLIYKGVINKYTLINQQTFKWYNANQISYKPDDSLLTAFENSKTKIHFILFGGTWCDDTQFIIPKFFKIQELSGLPDAAISFFAVDREKQCIGNISSAFGITNVPTIIVMKNGKEIGRVVEYGKSGKWDMDLMELVK